MLRVEKLLLPNHVCVNFFLKPGEALVLRGKNGSGKSLLLKALARLVPADFTAFFFKDHPISEWKVENYRSEVLYVAAQVFPGKAETVEEFLKAPLAFSLYKSHEQQFDVSSYLAKWKLGGDFQKLSSGQKQLLNILRALTLKARILLLDEVTANLDQEKTLEVEALLKEWLKTTGGSLVFVSHSPEQASRLGWGVSDFESLISR